MEEKDTALLTSLQHHMEEIQRHQLEGFEKIKTISEVYTGFAVKLQKIESEMIAVQQRSDEFFQRLMQVVDRVDNLQGRQSENVQNIERLLATQLTREEYLENKALNDEVINTLHEGVAELKARPDAYTRLLRYIIPIVAIFVTVLLASFGLNLTTLVFILQHVAGSH